MFRAPALNIISSVTLGTSHVCHAQALNNFVNPSFQSCPRMFQAWALIIQPLKWTLKMLNNSILSEKSHMCFNLTFHRQWTSSRPCEDSRCRYNDVFKCYMIMQNDLSCLICIKEIVRNSSIYLHNINLTKPVSFPPGGEGLQEGEWERDLGWLGQEQHLDKNWLGNVKATAMREKKQQKNI